MNLRIGGTMGWVAKALLRALGILLLLAMLFAASMGHFSLWFFAAACIAVAVWATSLLSLLGVLEFRRLGGFL